VPPFFFFEASRVRPPDALTRGQRVPNRIADSHTREMGGGEGIQFPRSLEEPGEHKDGVAVGLLFRILAG